MSSWASPSRPIGTRAILAFSRSIEDIGLLALVPPDILGLLGHEVGDLSSHVARRDSIGAGKLNPFDSH